MSEPTEPTANTQEEAAPETINFIPHVARTTLDGKVWMMQLAGYHLLKSGAKRPILCGSSTGVGAVARASAAQIQQFADLIPDPTKPSPGHFIKLTGRFVNVFQSGVLEPPGSKFDPEDWFAFTKAVVPWPGFGNQAGPKWTFGF